MEGLIKINGRFFPYPDRGLKLQVATLVDSGRNANGVMVGQKVGRDQYKVDSLQWNYLDAHTWSEMLKEFDNFFVVAEIPDMVNNSWRTLKMYPGDRTAKIWKLNKTTGLPSHYIECRVNIIDVGE